MEYNVIQKKSDSHSIFIPVDIKDKPSKLKCSNCKKQDCDCKTKEKSTKRGYKSHVPSACVNCKTAHLACDISRPCKRCVSLNKTDTCHDMQHKKRGRPKLREKRVYNDSHYEILYGTIQTPAITIKPATSKNTTPTNNTHHKSVISFVHNPIESFQSNHEKPLDYLPLDPSLDTPLFLNDPSLSPSQSMSQTPPSSTLQDTHTVTLILSMDICCAKVSDEIIKSWGYYPQELAHRSLYDFISPKDSDRLARLHRLLIDNAMNAQPHQPLPPTERTTSALFNDTDQSKLSVKAIGSRSFSDTIHIKKRSGDFELYEVVVYIGGGLGADLFQPATLSKQYIVAQFKKHEYEVMPIPITMQQPVVLDQPLSFVDKGLDDFIAVFSPMATASPSTLDLLKRDFPSYENVEKRLGGHHPSSFSHISSSTPSIPKINVAPVTNPLHRFLPSISSSVSLRPPTTVTHPTQQYFLQTSSSTLNAAASAAQNKSRPNVSEQNVIPGRKMEMSIRSLLC